MNRNGEPGVKPRLSGVVIHWRGEEHLERLRKAWPEDPRFELLVVDNSDTLAQRLPGARILKPGANLGFAGAANLGIREARGEAILLLNPDAEPLAGALDALLQGLEEHPEAAGLAPALVGEDGSSQHRWQLGPLPRPGQLLLQALGVATGSGAEHEPPSGAAIAQPAAAALVLRRSALESLGGLDDAFYPAWFEDVDLARRLAGSGQRLLYWPAARFRHALGGTVPALGYGPFLWIYNRNLMRYLGKHHGQRWRRAAVPALVAGALLRLVLLPVRRPRRARSRKEAFRGLGALLAGALSGWRRPRDLAARFAPPVKKTRPGAAP